MPGFTHLQLAQPVTFGHHLMAWYEMLNRDFSRLQDTKKRASSMPLGSGALSGNRYKLDRKLLAKRLSFDGISNNSIDAVSDRDFSLELLSAISILGVHLSRINEELIIWSSSQFNYIDLPEEFCTGSSIMPQKKNPDVSELMRGGSARTMSNLMGLLVLMKGLPLAYNRDMQEDKRFIFDSLDYSNSSLELLALMIKGMSVNTKKMKQDCELGHITATELADYLVLKGLAFRKAHELVGKIVAHADKQKKRFDRRNVSQTSPKTDKYCQARVKLEEIKLKPYLTTLLMTISLVSLLFINACGHRGPLNLPQESSKFEGNAYERL